MNERIASSSCDVGSRNVVMANNVIVHKAHATPNGINVRASMERSSIGTVSFFSQLAAHFSHLPLSYHLFLPKCFFFRLRCAQRILVDCIFTFILFDSIRFHLPSSLDFISIQYLSAAMFSIWLLFRFIYHLA